MTNKQEKLELQKELCELLKKMKLIHPDYYGKLVINVQKGSIINYNREDQVRFM